VNVASGLVLASALPASILGARWFAVLSTFVAINTILYVSMSLFKIPPKPYLSDVVRRHGRRTETRSICPKGHPAPDRGERRGAMSGTGKRLRPRTPSP
jgi:hypothetical protein